MILVVEVKSRIGNLQDTLRRLDVKARLGSVLAAHVGVERPASIVRALVMTDERSTRRVLVSHDALFGAFRLRGRAALQWIRRPAGGPLGLLWFEKAADSSDSRTKRRGPAS
jgi:hypothetical protein